MPEKAEGDTSKAPGQTRREALTEAPDMPPCEALHLVGYLFEIGPRVGEGAVTHGEIEAWQRNTGIMLNSWEARMLRALSVEYLNQARLSTARDCPPPWGDTPVPNLKAERAKNAVRALAAL